MRRRRNLLIAAGLLMLCCLGAVVSTIFFPESDEIAEETATVQVADAETEPSSTPELVEPTDIPPTAVPTATVPPTNISSPTAVPVTNTAVPVSEPTETAILPTNTSTAEPESIDGLGQTRESWEQEHTLSLDSSPLYGYDDNDYLIIYRDGRISNLNRLYDEGFTLDDARALSEQYIPADREFLETYSPPESPELIVDLYTSPLLADLFEDDAFIEGEPGQFIVIYFEYDGEVSSYLAALGNSP